MKRKYLLPQKGSFYKANLHCHSTVSDGRLTVEQLKEEYKKRGYSVVAFTDHNTYCMHDELNDDGFLAICGYEVDACEEGSWANKKVCHLNVYDKHPSPDKSAVLLSACADYRDKAAINDYIRKMTDDGFLVCYNHPEWSLERYPDYMPLDGFFAMEIFNTGCVTEGNYDFNTQAYEDMLRAGKRVFAVAADDNHNGFPLDSVRCDSFGGHVQIKSPSRGYDDNMTALERGDFYASTGATVEELYVEDGRVHLKTSGAKAVYCRSNCRAQEFAVAEKGKTITECSYRILPEMDYMRFEVIDSLENRAFTRAYFRDELAVDDD